MKRFSILFLLGLLACGGGSSDKSNPNPNPDPKPPTPIKVGIFRTMKKEVSGVRMTEQFQSTNASVEMSIARKGHRAVRLLNGNVLLVGGEYLSDGPTTLSTADIFNAAEERFYPSSAQFSFKYEWETVSANFALVPLQSGKILLAGGRAGTWTGTRSIEIYDPATEQVALKTPLPDEVLGFEGGFEVATNKVLLYGPRYMENSVYYFYPYAVLYDIETDTATKIPHDFNRMQAGLIQVANRDIYIFGGSTSSCGQGRIGYTDVIKCSVSDLLAGNPCFTKVGSLSVSRMGAGVTQLNDEEIGIYGGLDWNTVWPAEPGRLKTVEIFNTVTNVSTVKASLPSEVSFFNSILLQHDGYTLHAGGVDSQGHTSAAEYVHNASQNVAGTTGLLLEERRNHQATALNNGLVLITGGANTLKNSWKKTAEIYDTQKKLYITFPTEKIVSLGTVQFSCSYTNGVTWKVTTEKGSTAGVGTIDETGLYTAPEVLEGGITIIVTATAKDDATQFAKIRITVVAQ